MGDFDFLSQVTVGQYIPTGSVLHRLDGRIRIVGYTLIVLAVVFSQRIEGLVFSFAAALVGIFFSKISFRFALKGLIPPLPFLAILALLQVFFNPNPDWGPVLLQIGSNTIGLSDLVVGGILLLRFSALVLWVSLTTLTISTSEMIYGLHSLFKPVDRLGIPTRDFVMVLQIALRFLPFLAQSIERIAKAQASRGADWGTSRGGLMQRIRRIVPLIIPLFLSSLKRAENLALAMDARAYGSRPQRTSLVEMKLKPAELGYLLIAVAIAAATILV